jgi:hypothetical protein
VISYQVVSWFQILPFKCNLQRYTPDPAICQPEKINKPIQGHFGAEVWLYKRAYGTTKI